jgi:GNAT superfamily N-acetyltransferase
MPLTIQAISTQQAFKQFVAFPWTIYRHDPFWVPPLMDDRAAKLDLQRNPYWQNADRSLWIAYDGNVPVGTLAAIVDHRRNQTLKQSVGAFGFFECINDKEVACRLFESAGDWLRLKGMSVMRGPYNPSETDEVGILVEGFNSRPAILEAHTPSYYASLVESAGFSPYNQTVARLFIRPPEARTVEEIIPEKMQKVAAITRKRTDLTLRKLNLRRWNEEVRLACQIYNASLAGLSDFVALTEGEFKSFADSFKMIISPEQALIAEINGKPVGFILGLPDVNEALQHLNGRLWPFGILKLQWHLRHIHRVSFKILMILPDFQNRGIETVLVTELARAAWKKGYKEIDISLTGDENIKSNRFQENLGMKVYRRYRIYEKTLLLESACKREVKEEVSD